jgi:CHAD domain-containing protein
MRETLERELKLEPSGDFALPELPGEPLEPRLFTSTYYDTPPRSLARCGITLRRRVENGLARWQLKLPRADGRMELEAPGGPAGPPPELEVLLAAHLRHGSVEPVATLRTRRVGVRVLSGTRSLADVVLDSVDVLDAGHAAGAFAELEVELVDGDDRDLDRLSRILRRAGANRSPATPKLFRVLEVDGEAPPASGAAPVEQLRFLLRRQLRELETYDPSLRAGPEPEDLHRFRVATRRSRALIRASRPLVGEQLAALSDELRWLATLLGPPRDLDVVIAHLRGLLPSLEADAAGAELIIASLEEERAAAQDELVNALTTDRYLALLDRFAADVDSLAEADENVRIVDVAAAEARRLRKAHKNLRTDSGDEALHRVRIKAKHARYAAELAALADGKRFRKVVSSAKKLQDVIGEHQDAVVAERRVRALARARSALAAGRIVEAERDRRLNARAALPASWARVKRALAKAF